MRDLKVSEFMTTSLVTVRNDASVSSVDWEMVLADIRHVPIVDREDRLVGLVSDRDLLRSLRNPERAHLPVSAIMTTTIATVAPEASALDALEVLLARKVSAIPVVDAAGHLQGLVTSTDFLNLAYRALRGIPIDAPHAKA